MEAVREYTRMTYEGWRERELFEAGADYALDLIELLTQQKKSKKSKGDDLCQTAAGARRKRQS
jgi:hypothetical protein